MFGFTHMTELATYIPTLKFVTEQQKSKIMMSCYAY